MSDRPSFLFHESSPAPRRRSWAIPVSVTAHLVLVAALLHGRSPVFVAPSSVRAGASGTAVTYLYWSSGTSESDTRNGHGSEPKKSAIPPLTVKSHVQRKDRAFRSATAAPANGERETASAAAVPAAGSPYGSLSDGASSGAEVRPALPIATVEPIPGAEDLQGIAEGNVVIEITIDETGNIVAKTVVQSLGAAIDAKVLAALENWHFHPATRDGVPIPSRQDVVYHFKPRGTR